jgi:hypothetical protein
MKNAGRRVALLRAVILRIVLKGRGLWAAFFKGLVDESILIVG